MTNGSIMKTHQKTQKQPEEMCIPEYIEKTKFTIVTPVKQEIITFQDIDCGGNEQKIVGFVVIATSLMLFILIPLIVYLAT